MKIRITTLILLSGLLTSAIQAQKADSTLSQILETVVVTAERSTSEISTSTAGVSKISAEELRVLPTLNAGSILGLIPGMTFLDFDGLGYAPQSVTRGFYGGGEAEYVVVLVNGKPVNNLENGLVNWEQLVGSPNTSVEVLRGGASSLYGDAAIGAVINIRTEPVEETTGAFRLRAGNLGIRSGRASLMNRRYSIAADYSMSEGFRDHSDRSSGNVQASYKVVDQSQRSLTISGAASVREYDTPGPIRSSDTIEDGSPSLPFFKFDGANEETFRGGVDGDWRFDFATLNVAITGDYRSQNLVRTIPLSADFADTQERDLNSYGIRSSIQATNMALPISLANNITVGVDAYTGSMDSKYYQIATGGMEEYLNSRGQQGDIQSDGSAKRASAATYIQFDVNPTDRLKVSLGGRMDWIEDSFAAVADLSEPLPDASHSEFSPKAGVNYRYTSSATQVGNVYVSASQSFKAPTLDQLYDLRALPVPFPPYAVQISNAGLIPQQGTSYEAGFYHQVGMNTGWTAQVSGSVYTIDMINELDFSFETFQNVNIGASRHKGVESALRFAKSGTGSAFLNYTLQDVTLQAGDNTGNAVKAIPRHAFSAGVTAEVNRVAASFVVKGNRTMYVDDANTSTIPDYATVDMRISYSAPAYAIVLDVFNLFDKTYNSTAYQDPAGSDILFLFPASLRTISLGLDVSL